MAVTIRLPGPLRERAGQRAAVQVEAATVREALDALDRRFPGMRFCLCEETGRLRPYVNVFLETENIRDLQGLETPVPDGATLHVLHSVAGGVGAVA
ncbi:MAG: MoaD/ThiS family protein [Armatimonadota bacterium]|nr:MoaD/ThiS family protein [Armatimonadota bacterium]MDR7497262.1 MoaD/ThiS family protein [Armatimonadota bacterium]